MNHRVFPSIGEEYYEEVLPNGLTLRVVPKRGFARCHAFLGINYGSIDLGYTLDGVHYLTPPGCAHYLEHKMFDLPEGDAQELFAQHGGNPNAFTGYTMTAYYFDCTEQLEENLRLLLHMVMTPCFTVESVRKEMGIISQEIRMYQDSAENRLYDRLFGAMYATHPIRIPIEGTLSSIRRITPEMLYACYHAFYRTDNMMLCVTGDVDPEDILRITKEETPAAAPKGQILRDRVQETQLIPHRKSVSCRMDVSMNTFALGFPCTTPANGSEEMKREYVGDLAADLLIGTSSPLYSRLYDAGLIDSDFAAGYENVRDLCMFTLGGDSSDPRAVTNAILQEVQRLVHDGISQETFENLRRSNLGRNLRDLDSFENICYRMCAYFFDGSDYFNFPEAIGSITPEDVLSFLQDTVRASYKTLSVVRPLTKGGLES